MTINNASENVHIKTKHEKTRVAYVHTNKHQLEKLKFMINISKLIESMCLGKNNGRDKKRHRERERGGQMEFSPLI